MRFCLRAKSEAEQAHPYCRPLVLGDLVMRSVKINAGLEHGKGTLNYRKPIWESNLQQ
jgi:hypothetical protein